MQEYKINEIITSLKNSKDYFAEAFENIEDSNIEWPHRHSFYSIVWFTEGTGINVIDFSEFEIIPNRVFKINPKQVHNWNYSENSKGYVITFEASLAKELNIDFKSSFYDIPDEDALFFREIVLRLISESNKKDKLGQNNSELAIAYLCSLLAKNEICQTVTNQIIIDFKSLICNDYSISKTITQYADCLNISTEELNTICKSILGITAKQVELDLKIIEAKRLLIYTTLNASETAFCLGFEDTSYFSRIFKKKTGYSPAEFREKYLNKVKKS